MALELEGRALVRIHQGHNSAASCMAWRLGILAWQRCDLTIPDNARYADMHLNNAATGLNNQNRAQNEVAAMALSREALEHRQHVPAIYGWASTAEGRG
jgi:hypothetical protein